MTAIIGITTYGRLEREVASLKALLVACDVRRPLLIGHSDGGTLALLFAAAFPGLVEAIVSEAAHVFVEDQTLVGIREVVARWEEGDLKPRLERYHGYRFARARQLAAALDHREVTAMHAVEVADRHGRAGRSINSACLAGVIPRRFDGPVSDDAHGLGRWMDCRKKR